jgi:hypothetical protein
MYDLHPGADYFESGALDINDARLVVGYGKLNVGGTLAIAWTLVDKSVVPLELDEGPALPNSTWAWSVSADGAIAGNGEVLDGSDKKSVRGLYWNSVLETPILLEPPDGFGRCWPLGMSSDGMLVVGVAHPAGVNAPSGVVWHIGSDPTGAPVVTDVLVLPGLDGDSTSAAWGATSVQDGLADVVGVTRPLSSSGRKAACWTVAIDSSGKMIAVGPAGVQTPNSDPSEATAVNDRGAVAGTSGSVGFVAFPDRLLTLNPLKRTFVTSNSVQDLNDADDPLVVGYLTEGVNSRLAVVWIGGEAKKLDSLAGKSSFNKLEEARGINNSGDMVGIGWSNVSEHHAFLMIKN